MRYEALLRSWHELRHPPRRVVAIRGSLNALIHISGQLSGLQRKVPNVLLANAYYELPRQETYSIPIRMLADLAGFNSNNYEVLKEALRGINRTQVEYDVIEQAKRGKMAPDWGVSTLISEAHITGGLIWYAYSPFMRKMLYRPETYTELSLRMQMWFRSPYAMALYESCKRFLGVGSTGFLDVDIWRKLLAGPDRKINTQRFADFNKSCIRTSMKAINERSDIEIDAEFNRRGMRSVREIKFRVQRSARYDELKSRSACGSADGEEMARALEGIGIARGIAQTLVSEYGVTRCRDVVVHLRNAQASRRRAISNPAGWVVSMLSKEAKKRRGERVACGTDASAPAAKAEQQALMASVDADRSATIAALAEFSSLPDEDRRQWLGEFRSSLPSAMRKSYDCRGHESPMFAGLLIRFLRERSVVP